MFNHCDALEELNQHIPLHDKLMVIHQSLKKVFPFLIRVSVAIYDPETRVLKTFIHSSGEDNPLDHYQALIDDAPSLKEILDKGKPRVVNDLTVFKKGKHEHTKKISKHDYAASYTLPIFNEGEFFGFMFFNSSEKDVFTENVLQQIDIYGHLIAVNVISEFTSIHTLTAAVKTAGHITHIRDPETGSHLDRMSRFSRLIAIKLADKYNFDDDYIEHIFMFAPLHDIGKIGIPDNILLKPEKLDDAESMIMKTHVAKGREIIEDLLKNFGLQNFQYMNVLRNIAESHHEAVNGTGYPAGKKNGEIPIEARIVAVADVFDALTSERSYKEAWNNDKAIDLLKQLAGETLDQDCVTALIENIDEVEIIQQQFQEEIHI